MKKTITILILVSMVVLTACAGNAMAVNMLDSPQDSTEIITTSIEVDPTIPAVETSTTPEVDYDFEDLDTTQVDSDGATSIQLDGDAITVNGTGATVDESVVRITTAGTYQVSGTLNDGQIIIDTTDADNVILILAGVDLTSLTSAPIYVASAEKVIINLAEGSENTITDSDSYLALDESGEPNATIFSKDDLTINGEGTLTVNANYNNGIASKDDLKITSGNITVNAVNDGIKGRDSVAIRDGIITINAGADGIQSTNEEDTDKGYIAVEGGTLNITAALDGIQAATNLSITGGEINIIAGGGSLNTSTDGGGIWEGRGMEGNANKPTESAKGLKAGVDITIAAGTLNIDSADDSINANNSVIIDDGNILMSSGDDGIHADASLTINGGEINLTQSYEGLESAIITINDGTIHLKASDDGINAGGGTDSSSVNGRPGQNEFAASGNYYVYINGGYIFVDADGDGLDTNGSFAMTDGVVLVNGPTNNGNGPLDYMGTFNVSGGFLVAVGSSGMAQAPSEDSTQYAVLQNLGSMQAAGTLIHIETAAGEDVLTFLPTKEYQSVLISSPELQDGESYVLYTGGSSSGISVDGLITDGEYTPGTQVVSFTITSIITGEAGSGFPGGGPGGDRPTQP